MLECVQMGKTLRQTTMRYMIYPSQNRTQVWTYCITNHPGVIKFLMRSCDQEVQNAMAMRSESRGMLWRECTRECVRCNLCMRTTYKTIKL